jgi:hypothetical protein
VNCLRKAQCSFIIRRTEVALEISSGALGGNWQK